MTEKELEKLFQSKLSEREVPFNPENWAAMEQILDSQKGKGLVFFWRWAAAIVGFGVLAALLNLSAPAIPASSVAGEEVQEQPSELRKDEPGKLQPEEILKSGKEQPASKNGQPNSTQSVASERNSEKPQFNAPTAETKETVRKSVDSSGNSETPQQSNTTQLAFADNSSPQNIPEEGASTSNEEKAPFNFGELAFKDPVVSFGSDLSLHQMNIEELEQEENIKPQFGGNQSMYAQAGMVVSTAFNDRTAGLGFETGLHYRYRINGQLSLDAGIAYVRQNNVGIVSVSDSTFYDFGKETIHTEKTTSEFEILVIPIRFSFEPVENHQLSFAFYGSYLLAAHEEVYREHTRMKMAPIIHQSERIGNSENYNRFNYGLGAGYHYQLNNKLSLGADIRWGLSDLTRGGDPAFDKTHQNFNTRLQLRYSLWSN